MGDNNGSLQDMKSFDLVIIGLIEIYYFVLVCNNANLYDSDADARDGGQTCKDILSMSRRELI